MKSYLQGIMILLFLILTPLQAVGELSTDERLDSVEFDLTPSTKSSYTRNYTLNVSTQANSVELDEISLTERYHVFVQISLDEGLVADGFSSVFYTATISLYPFSSYVPPIISVEEKEMRIGDTVNIAISSEQSEAMKEVLLAKQEIPIIPKLMLSSSSNMISALNFTVSIQVYQHRADSSGVVDSIRNDASMSFRTVAYPNFLQFSRTEFIQENQRIFVFLPYEILPNNIEGMNLSSYYLDLTLIFSSDRGLEESFEDFLEIRANGILMQWVRSVDGDHYYSAYLPIDDLIEITIGHTGEGRSMQIMGIIGENDRIYVNRESRSVTIAEIVGTSIFMLMVSYLSVKMPIIFERRKLTDKQMKNRKRTVKSSVNKQGSS